MAYIPYVTAADYAQYGNGDIPFEDLEKLLT